MRRWNGWWKVADREQFTTFFVIGAVTLLVFMTLTYVTVGTGGSDGELRLHQGPGRRAQATTSGAWLGTTFWLIGSVVLFSTNLAVLDMVGRITADVLKTGPLREQHHAGARASSTSPPCGWRSPFGSAILLSGVDAAARAAGHRVRP